MTVSVKIENKRFIHLTLDEQTVRNLLALLWDYENFDRGTTLYREIVDRTLLTREDYEKVTKKGGEFTFYNILA
jgi:hypothetical protein